MTKYYIKYNNDEFKKFKFTNLNQIDYIKIYNLDFNRLCYNCK